MKGMLTDSFNDSVPLKKVEQNSSDREDESPMASQNVAFLKARNIFSTQLAQNHIVRDLPFGHYYFH